MHGACSSMVDWGFFGAWRRSGNGEGGNTHQRPFSLSSILSISTGSRQIGPRAIFCGKLGPGKFVGGKLGPKKILAANWAPADWAPVFYIYI